MHWCNLLNSAVLSWQGVGGWSIQHRGGPATDRQPDRQLDRHHRVTCRVAPYEEQSATKKAKSEEFGLSIFRLSERYLYTEGKVSLTSSRVICLSSLVSMSLKTFLTGGGVKFSGGGIWGGASWRLTSSTSNIRVESGGILSPVVRE